MANYPTQPYSLLKSRFKALAGLESLQTIDATFLRDLVNSRARQAYERFPWPIFTVVGEPVVLTDNTIISYNGSGSANKSLANKANVVFRIHKQNPITTRYPDEYTFLTDMDSDGNPTLRIIEPTTLNGQTVYVTYRKDQIEEINSGSATSGYYGDEADDNPEIPWIFFEYCVHGAYASFLRGDGQNQKAQQEDQNSEALLVMEIDKVATQGRQFRHDILQYRPPSQFTRHNVNLGGSPVGVPTAQFQNNPS